jgi:hypothetical protein
MATPLKNQTNYKNSVNNIAKYQNKFKRQCKSKTYHKLFYLILYYSAAITNGSFDYGRMSKLSSFFKNLKCEFSCGAHYNSLGFNII